MGKDWKKLPADILEKMVDEILQEGDMDEDGYLNFSEFEHIIEKSPNFVDTFRFLVWTQWWETSMKNVHWNFITNKWVNSIGSIVILNLEYLD